LAIIEFQIGGCHIAYWYRTGFCTSCVLTVIHFIPMSIQLSYIGSIKWYQKWLLVAHKGLPPEGLKTR